MFLTFFFVLYSLAQSNDQNFPTPITTNEIAATIKARDMGDSRLTTHFYAFNGVQGDIFISVITKNFSGDIDIFTVEGLRPLTKMVIYADGGVNETGRLIYLRKPEKLLLRIEGRTPGDDAAIYRIRFGGSFVALSPTSKDGAKTTPKVTLEDSEKPTVNMVGTIIDNRSVSKPDTQPVQIRKTLTIPDRKPAAGKLQLVVILKDGKRLEFPMSLVRSIIIDKGILTVIDSDGLVEHFSMLNVVKFSIE